ncbi:hypothetical protein CJ030_MR8G007976 [Morella rubra]|uniref:Secreted protein n=1 Tax=Morella rubra TaxID=262757 RepID=A0A6A1UQ61_9ROSI|nr:hypothetical protein CJ030_MR8G007976 [Morella rubra]
MAAGGKCLHAIQVLDLLVLVIRLGTRAAATPSNGADDDLPSLASVNMRGTPQSSYASIFGIRNVKGRTPWLSLEKACIVGKLSVHIPMAVWVVMTRHLRCFLVILVARAITCPVRCGQLVQSPLRG